MKEKKFYELLYIQVVEIQNADVITTSNNGGSWFIEPDEDETPIMFS